MNKRNLQIWVELVLVIVIVTNLGIGMTSVVTATGVFTSKTANVVVGSLLGGVIYLTLCWAVNIYFICKNKKISKDLFQGLNTVYRGRNNEK